MSTDGLDWSTPEEISGNSRLSASSATSSTRARRQVQLRPGLRSCCRCRTATSWSPSTTATRLLGIRTHNSSAFIARRPAAPPPGLRTSNARRQRRSATMSSSASRSAISAEVRRSASPVSSSARTTSRGSRRRTRRTTTLRRLAGLRNGEYDIQLACSTDGGLTWTRGWNRQPGLRLDHYFAAVDQPRRKGDRIGVSYYRSERVSRMRTRHACRRLRARHARRSDRVLRTMCSRAERAATPV